MAEMKTYDVTIPIGGHITVTVEAEDEGHAIAAAFIKDLTADEISNAMWEMLEKVNSGNVCHFPGPWEPEVTEQ